MRKIPRRLAGRMIREMYITQSVVRRMLNLKPITDAIPELESTVNSVPEAKRPKRRCCGGGRRGANPPASSAKVVAQLIAGLSQDKKELILDVLGASTLRGVLPRNNHLKSVILAEKPS